MAEGGGDKGKAMEHLLHLAASRARRLGADTGADSGRGGLGRPFSRTTPQAKRLAMVHGGTHESLDGRGFNLRQEALKASWWVGRDRSGERSFARRGRSVGRGWSAAMGRVRAGWSRRLAWPYVMVRALDGRVWSRTLIEGLAHGGLGDPTWGPRRFVDGAVLVVTFSTRRAFPLRVAMALGTVKD